MATSSGSAAPQGAPTTQPAVNATSPNTTPATTEQQSDGYIPHKAKKELKFENAFDKTMYELNLKHGGSPDDPEFRSLAKITEDVQAAAPENKHGSPDVPARESDGRFVAKDASQPAADGGNQPVPQPQAPQKKRYQVGEKVYELTPEQQDRTIQKGLYLEGKNQALAQWERKLEAGLQQLQHQQQQFQQTMQGFAQNPAAIYEQMFGPEKARQAFEPYVGQHVLREVEYEKNPVQRTIDTQNQQIQHLSQQLQQAQQHLQTTQNQQQTSVLTQHFQQMIVQALENTRNEWMKGDLGAADMAAWMQRWMDQNPRHTEQELAQFMEQRAPGLMKEDWKRRTLATTAALAASVGQARKTNNAAEVIRLGEELVDMLGRDVMYAIGKYHVAVMRKNQPQFPRQTIETQRAPEQQAPVKPQGYLKAEEVEAKRRRIVAALERGENVPENVWEINW